MFETNWDAVSHEDIDRQVRTATGDGFGTNGVAWRQLAGRLTEVATSVERATAGIRETRSGPAAEGAQGAVGPMAGWVEQARGLADSVGGVSQDQGRSFGDTARAMPAYAAPADLTWDWAQDLAGDDGGLAPFLYETDEDAAMHERAEAERRARQLMTDYQTGSAVRAETLPQFVGPGSGGATPSVTVEPSGTSGGRPADGVTGGSGAGPGGGAIGGALGAGAGAAITGGAAGTLPAVASGARGPNGSTGSGAPSSGLPAEIGTGPAAGVGAPGPSSAPGGGASPGPASPSVGTGEVGAGQVGAGPPALPGTGTGGAGSGRIGPGGAGRSGAPGSGSGFGTGAGSGYAADAGLGPRPITGTGVPGSAGSGSPVLGGAGSGTGTGGSGGAGAGAWSGSGGAAAPEGPLGGASPGPGSRIGTGGSVLEPALGRISATSGAPVGDAQRGMMPFAPMGAAGGAGGDQVLHRPDYLLEDDRDALLGRLPPVAPPVIER